MIALLLLLATPHAMHGEEPFVASAEHFSTAAECKARLAAMADDARHERFDAVEGPYDLAAGDVRIHTVAAEGNGHRIAEHRCLAEKLSSRSWRHSMEEEETDFTVESVARSAEWLKKGRSEKH